MEGIESVEMLPDQGLSASGRLRPLTRAINLVEMTPEAMAEVSDCKKQALAKDFESILLTQLFNEVKESLSASSFDDDAGSDQFHGIFWSFLAEDVADKGGFGLWQDFYHHFQDMDDGGEAGNFMDKQL